jgi:hypothetical protein
MCDSTIRSAKLIHLDGIISYFESSPPTDEEMVSLPHVVLTSADDWYPYSKAFTEKEEIAWRCAVVAKERSNRIKLEEQIAQNERDKQQKHSVDLNLSSQMVIHARRVLSFTCYEQYVTTNMHDLSCENLYTLLVKCIQVASDDSIGDGPEEGEDVDQLRSLLKGRARTGSLC